MPRHKAASQCKVNGWLSANPDNREPAFIQVGVLFLRNEVYGSLSDGATRVYMAMCAEAGKNRDFYFSKGVAMRDYHFRDEKKYYRGVNELIEKGFIEKVNEPGAAQYARTKFRFVFEWKGVSKPK